MRIDCGLFGNMVLQRTRANVSNATISGSTAATGPVTARVTAKGKTLAGFAQKKIGTAKRGTFTAALKGLPVGGPYDIELTAGGESCLVENVLVGDVWVLGGQSNMQGCGLITKEAKLPANPMIRNFYMDDTWRVAKDTLHNMWQCVDQVHIDLCGGVRPAKPAANWGVGPGVSFANAMFEATGIPQGMLACAHGGTTMDQWDPAKKSLEGKSLYGAMMRRFRKNGSAVAGMLWYQGCSDANPTVAPLYTERMKKFVASVRRDFKAPKMPFAMVQISRVVGWGDSVHWNRIQEQQLRLQKSIPLCAVVPAIDLSLDDSIHLSGASQVRLGWRLADAMQALLGKGRMPIELGKVTTGSERGVGTVSVEWKNVADSLHSLGRPAGFSVRTTNGTERVFDCNIDGKNRVYIRTGLSPNELKDAFLSYGAGTDPYCNIVDGKDRSLPVFGPLSLGTPRATTPYAKALRVSQFMPGVKNIKTLPFPRKTSSLGLTPWTFGGNFCDMHELIQKRGTADNLLYFVCAFDCSEPMRLAALVGYDGPVKAWIDGKQIVCDPKGTNPATPEKGRKVFAAKAGKHEIVVALGTNHGKAWGVFVSFERLDVPARLLKKGPEAYVMPRILG